MASGRKRDAGATRADILAAARAQFARHGYERATVRAIAADVGVDAALINRYFGGKEGLFAEAVDFRVDVPDLTDVPPERLAGVMLHQFFKIWEEQDTFLALLRAAMTSAAAAATMRTIFERQVAPVLGPICPDHPRERVALAGSFLIGLATTRYALETPAAADISHADLIAWTSPVFAHLLTGPYDSSVIAVAPPPGPSDSASSVLVEDAV